MATAASARVVGTPSGHGLADDVFADDRAEGRLAITPAREGRAPRALQLQIAARAIGVDDFPQQEGAAVAKLRREAAELVAGVGLGDRLGPLRYLVAGKRRHAVRRV